MSYRGGRPSVAAQYGNYGPPAPAAGQYSMGYASEAQWNGDVGNDQQAYASYGGGYSSNAYPPAAGSAGRPRGGGDAGGYSYNNFYESHGPVASLSSLGGTAVAPGSGSIAANGGSRIDSGGGPMAVSMYRSSAFEPWGFRLQGGADYRTQLTVKQVVRGSPAERNLQPGDVLLSINGTLARSFSHAEAAQLIRDSGTSLQLQVLPYASASSLQLPLQCSALAF